MRDEASLVGWELRGHNRMLCIASVESPFMKQVCKGALPVPALTLMASSAMAKGSALENLTVVLMLQSSGGSLEEGRAAGCRSAALCCSCWAAAAALLKWSDASSACRLKLLLKSCSICSQTCCCHWGKERYRWTYC